MRRAIVCFVVLAIIDGTAAPAHAQQTSLYRDPVLQVGIGLLGVQPVGGFHDQVGTTGGLASHLVYLPSRGAMGLRLNLGFIPYGSEQTQVPLGAGQVVIDQTTDNNLMFVTAGPQVTLGAGPARPYVEGALGFHYLYTMTSWRGSASSDNFASSVNYDDFAFAYGAGIGVSIALRSGKVPLALDLEGRYQRGNRATYLRKGGMYEDDNGNLVIAPVRSRTDLILLNAGITLGFR